MKAKKIFNLFLMLVSSSFLSTNLLATAWCSEGHCSAVYNEMNEFCKANGMAGKPYMVIEEGKACLCTCSCVSQDTLISIFDQNIEPVRIDEISRGEMLKSPFATNSSARVDKILGSDYSENPTKVHYIKFSNGENLVVSPDHSFVGPSMKVRAAEELRPGALILDQGLKEIRVIENHVDENFQGKLLNLIVNKKSAEAKNHFIITNSILSGDWVIQSNYSSFKSEIDARLGRINTFEKTVQKKEARK